MEPADRLLRLFKYDNWANEQVLLSLQENMETEDLDKAVTLFAHIAGAQELWFRRIEDLSLEGLQVWPKYQLPKTLQTLKALTTKWQRLIEDHRSDLDRIVSYENSKGTPYDSILSDILHHVIIHGQHHRAQIAKILRAAHIEPPATDFIFYTRAS